MFRGFRSCERGERLLGVINIIAIIAVGILDPLGWKRIQEVPLFSPFVKQGVETGMLQREGGSGENRA